MQPLHHNSSKSDYPKSQIITHHGPRPMESKGSSDPPSLDSPRMLILYNTITLFSSLIFQITDLGGTS